MSTFEPDKLRKTILNLAHNGSTVHIACAFSIVEILAALYSKHLHYPNNDPRHASRDYLVLSKGHGVMAQYACMYELGWITNLQIEKYFSDGSALTGLADSHVPGIEATTGSLGHGFSVAVGLALGAKLKGSRQRTFVITGDGELNEGSIWEAALLASHHKLSDLLLIVDANGFQAMGQTDEIMSLGSIEAKFESFGFEVAVVDGHSVAEISAAVEGLFGSDSDCPKALVCRTSKGSGVSFMAGNNAWHYTRLNDENYLEALNELDGVDK